MKKFSLVIILLFKWSISEALFQYDLTVFNNSSALIELRINNKKAIKIPAYQAYKTKEGRTSIITGESIDLSEIEIKNASNSKKLSIALLSDSKIEIEVSDSLLFRVTGIPFLEQQNLLTQVYFPRKILSNNWERSEYLKRKDPRFTRPQVDSIEKGHLEYRKGYLDFVDSLITLVRNYELAYHLFKSEFLSPKIILTIGKERIVAIHNRLKPEFSGTEIGQEVFAYIRKIKSSSVGANVENFRFKTFENKSYQFYELFNSAKNVLLIFTSKGCKGCKEQIPIIRELKNVLKNEVRVLYISLDLNQKYWEDDLKIGYPGLITVNLDPFNYSVNLQEKFMVTYIPQLFLIDKDHKILYDNLSPYEDPNLERLKELLGIK